MIFEEKPLNWKELQDCVCQILNQSGYSAESPKVISTARAVNLEVDVYAVDNSITRQVIICECKNWDTNIPQAIIHAFRTQIEDAGANLGLLIAKNGFQIGARLACNYTNIKLLTWDEFESLFEPLWYKKYFLCQVNQICDAFIEYIEPCNTRIFRKADLLSPAGRQNFIDLREKHRVMFALCSYLSAAYYCIGMEAQLDNPSLRPTQLQLPLEEQLPAEELYKYPYSILKAISYFGLLHAIENYVIGALSEFDSVFGERA